MSLSNKIIKKGQTIDLSESAFVSENFIGNEEKMLGDIFKRRKKEMEKELTAWKEEQYKKVEADIEKVYREGYEKGKETAYQEIVEQVMAENERKMREDYEDKMDEAREIHRQANEYLLGVKRDIGIKKREWVEKNEEELAEVLSVALSQLFGKAVEFESLEIKRVLKESLDKTEAKNQSVWLRVGPKLKDLIEQNGFDENGFEFIMDPSLKDYDFLMETDNEWVDGRIESKIEMFKKYVREWVNENGIFD